MICKCHVCKICVFIKYMYFYQNRLVNKDHRVIRGLKIQSAHLIRTSKGPWVVSMLKGRHFANESSLGILGTFQSFYGGKTDDTGHQPPRKTGSTRDSIRTYYSQHSTPREIYENRTTLVAKTRCQNMLGSTKGSTK